MYIRYLLFDLTSSRKNLRGIKSIVMKGVFRPFTKALLKLELGKYGCYLLTYVLEIIWEVSSAR